MRYTILLLLFCTFNAHAIDVYVNASVDRKPISPYIYGRNNALSDNSSSPVSETTWQLYRDAGVRIVRENGGNNASKYNWRLKLSSHPDWYNNVYQHDWDYAATSLQQNLPGVQGIWSMQLLGWAAASRDHNFNDWGYNQSQWWQGVSNNWAGGGGPDQGDGDTDLYLTPWPPDSTVGILDHWFGNEGLGLNPDWIRYWHLDNEPGIWNSTHDDVMPELVSANEYMNKFFRVAKKARTKYPDIKICGPVFSNEWLWYNWNNKKIESDGSSYTFAEYFIKRIAEEQEASGVRLLDVMDFHFYPYETEPADIVNLHRVWYDKSYEYPGANGVKRAGSYEWDSSINKEYILERCRVWLEKYMGPDHGVTFGISEIGVNTSDPNLNLVCYASNLGVFMKNGIEYFTPWDWNTGMWETLHLFSRYNKEMSVSSTSSNSRIVSAYSSLNNNLDSLTVVLINRDLVNSQAVTVHLESFVNTLGNYDVLSLNDLPATETFVSHSDNALRQRTITVNGDSLNLSLPPLSVTSVLLAGNAFVNTGISKRPELSQLQADVYPNPFNPVTNLVYTLPVDGNVTIDLFNINGRLVKTLVNTVKTRGRYTVKVDGSDLPSGIYIISLQNNGQTAHKKIMLVK